MNHPGEIAQLAAIAAPSVALVTNAQREHQEFMHTVEAVAHEAARRSPPAGQRRGRLSGRRALFPIWDALAGSRRTLRFGLQPGLDVYAEQILAEVSSTRVQVTPVGTADLVLPVAGLHNLRNALAAIAASVAAAPLEAAIRASARGGPHAAQGHERRNAAHRRFPTTPILTRCVWPSTCWRASRALVCWCWATWAKSETTVPPCMSRWAITRASRARRAHYAGRSQPCGSRRFRRARAPAHR